MKYILKDKEIELTDEEVSEIVKQNSQPVVEKKVGIQIKNRWTGKVIFISTKTTLKEAIEEGKANLGGADLRGADLRETNLRGANLGGADLRGADLRETNLRGANLGGADLRGADLREANLREANLRGADLYGADLYGAELRNAKFYGHGGTIKIKKENLKGFLGALGFILEE